MSTANLYLALAGGYFYFGSVYVAYALAHLR